MDSFFQKVVDAHLSKLTVTQVSPVSGGCINNTVKVTTSQGSFFLKYNARSTIEFFITEASGLSLLASTKTLKVPQVLGQGQIEDKSYLLLEWIESGYASSNFWKLLGEGVAKLHRTTLDYFGLDYNNFIGRLPQSNKNHASWYDFFVEERLKPQLNMGYDSGLIDQQVLTRFERLFPQLSELIPDEPPALLHGDLWSGNFLANQESLPVVIDPAIYYGHRETELAYTHLFGGFDQQFYHHYFKTLPVENGFEERIGLHNLYPLLVHVNLFGSSYLSGINSTLKRYT